MSVSLTSLKFVGPDFFAAKKQLVKERPMFTTFRLGTKWLNPALLGDVVELWHCPEFHNGDCDPAVCEHFGTAALVSMTAAPFWAVSELDFRRCPGTQDPGKILEIMQKAYGSKAQNSSIVTVLTLQVTAILQNIKVLNLKR